jgi:hypothetical protein
MFEISDSNLFHDKPSKAMRDKDEWTLILKLFSDNDRRRRIGNWHQPTEFSSAATPKHS